MNKRIIWNQGNMTALLAAAGGCFMVMAASPIVFALPLFGVHVSSPVHVQVLPLTLPLGFTILGYVGGAFLGASIAGLFGQENRGPFPVLVAVAALAGAAGGFLFIPKGLSFLLKLRLSGSGTMSIMMLSYLPVFLFSFCAARLICVAQIPRPASRLSRLLITILGFMLVLVGIRLSAGAPWPAQGTDAERTTWCRRELGRPYESLFEKLQTSPGLQNLLGPSFELVPGHTGGSIMLNNTAQFFQADFETRSSPEQASIEAWISTPYQTSNPPTYQISVKSSSGTIYINPEGALDAQRMAANGRSVMADLRDRVLALYGAGKYAEVIQALEGRPRVPVTGDDLMMEPDVLLATAKSYEFLKKNREAAGQYGMAATRFQYSLKPDHEKAIHLAQKALSLDPGNMSAQMILHPTKTQPGVVEKTLTQLIDAGASRRRAQLQAQAKASLSVEWQRYKPIYDMVGMSEVWSLMESGKCDEAEKLLSKPVSYEKMEKTFGAASRATTIKTGLRLCYERTGNSSKADLYK